MNQSSPTPDGELWRQIVVGDVAPEDPRVLARVAADPAFAQRLRELQDTEQWLAAAARAEAAWRSRAAQTPAPAVRPDLVGGTLATLAGAPATLRRSPNAGRRFWLTAAAALVCVAGGLAAWALVSSAPPAGLHEDDERPLGSVLGLRVAPHTGDGGVELSWRGGEPLARYRVLVFDPAAAPGAPPVLPPYETAGNRWLIDAKTFQALPAGVRWRVEVVVRGEVRRRDEAPLR